MSKDAYKGDSKALQEFLAEAQDISEALGNNLMRLEAGIKQGDADPGLVNELFRGMHTLKSLSGTFGVEPLTQLAHCEENLLGELRLGRVALSSDVLDLLFESVDLVTGILRRINETADNRAADALPQVESLIEQLTRASVKGNVRPTHPPPRPASAIDPKAMLAPEVFEVLTEYEEHRLRTNVERRVPLYKVRTKFGLYSIDKDLDAIKSLLKPLGEIITYLPGSQEKESDRLEIEIIFALQKSFDELKRALETLDVAIEKIEAKALLDHPSALEPDMAASGETLDVRALPGPSGGKAMAAAPIAPQDGKKNALSLRSVDRSVRIDIRKLDDLMNVVSELAIVRGSIARMSDELRTTIGRRDLKIELHRINRSFDRQLAQLQEGILEARMVPLDQILNRLSRMIRKISHDLDKQIHFVVSGAETEIDKLIIEELSNPLMHIIRNAIDHGIESPMQRKQADKPEVGTIALTAYQKGNQVVIEIEDDGAGIDPHRILEVAQRQGVVTAEQGKAMTQQEAVDLVFLPGVSTAAQATEISGRGVGMDIVKTDIASIGGVVEVQSELSIGTKITIILPVTMAIVPALLVAVGGRIYAVPNSTVIKALLVPCAGIHTILRNEAIIYDQKTLFLCHLDRFFGLSRSRQEMDNACVLVASAGQRRLGLVVDAIAGQQNIVIKPLNGSLGKVDFLVGATDIGEQRLALVLDTARIIGSYLDSDERGDSRTAVSE